MAKLFGSDYHEHSNTWYFKDMVENYCKDEISWDIEKNETNQFIFTFKINNLYDHSHNTVKIIYDQNAGKIIQESCSVCTKDLCKHYLSVLNYAYQHLSTNLMKQNFIITHQTSFNDFNEYWQKIKLNASIHIQDIFDKNSDKIRIIFKNYDPFDIFLIAQSLADKLPDDLNHDQSFMIETAHNLFTLEELNLIKILNQNKASVSRKGNFFNVYKKDFAGIMQVLLPVLQNVYLEETGEKLVFNTNKSNLNFTIEMIDAYNFILKPAFLEGIQAFFPGRRSYYFKDNKLHCIDLPITPEIQKEIFDRGFLFKRSDLIYMATVFSRQLSLIGCYVDLPQNCDIPFFYDQKPVIVLNLEKVGHDILVKGKLKYEKDVQIPLHVLNSDSELLNYAINNKGFWFYVPYSIKLDIRNFCETIRVIPYDEFITKSEFSITTENDKDYLKKALFEFEHSGWKIEISEDLKKEFVYRFDLKPTLKMNTDDTINWFSYEIVYEHEEITLSQDELRMFLRSKEKYYKTPDGKLIYIANREMFDEMENLIKKSEKDKKNKYRSSIFNLPWIYQLSNNNPFIRIYGDHYINQMYSCLLKRQLERNPELSGDLKPIMRSYQKAGFYWLKMLEKFKLNGILADDMGLGKTLQALSVVASLSEEQKAIIICPKTLLYNWANEIEKFCPHLSWLIYEGSKEERAELLKLHNVRIYLISYAIVQNDLDFLKNIKFHYIIIDEAQHIKNPLTLRSKAVKKLQGLHKIALTGTPLENSISELWSIFDFLMPGYLPGLKKFKAELSKPDQQESRVQQYISPFLLRRKKQEVLIELPDKQEQVLYCKMTEQQEKMYINVIHSVRHNLNLDQSDNVNYIHLLAGLTKLRQICDHPMLINHEYQSDPALSGKVDLLEEIINEAHENGKKILIFSQYIAMLKIIKELLQRSSIPFEYMDGMTKDRHKVIEHFNNNEKIRAFLISLKTGGYGINLTSADTVILVDPWWNPMVENQAIDRAYRIGQTKKVNIYRIITKGTVEEKIIHLQQSKKDLFESVIEGGNQMIRNMEIDDIRYLFEYEK